MMNQIELHVAMQEMEIFPVFTQLAAKLDQKVCICNFTFTVSNQLTTEKVFQKIDLWLNTKHKHFVSTLLRFEHGAELKTDDNMRPPRRIAQGDESLTVVSVVGGLNVL